MRSWSTGLLIIFLSGVLWPGQRDLSYAQDLPLWELGIGSFAYNAPDYRGSDQRGQYLWPVPYFIYRGKRIEAKNSGLTSNFFESPNFRVRLSFSGALGVKSENNEAREGMPIRPPVAEAGPAAIWDLWKSTDEKNILAFSLPLRSVWSAELIRLENQGFNSTPSLSWLLYPQPKTLGLFMEVTTAAMFATKTYHQYYYGVAPEHSRNGRPSYQAKGGYSGSHLTWFMSKRLNDYYGTLFFRYDYLNGAAFIDSPMVRTKHYLSVGISFVWYFLQSSSKGRPSRPTF